MKRKQSAACLVNFSRAEKNTAPKLINDKKCGHNALGYLFSNETHFVQLFLALSGFSIPVVFFSSASF